MRLGPGDRFDWISLFAPVLLALAVGATIPRTAEAQEAGDTSAEEPEESSADDEATGDLEAKLEQQEQEIESLREEVKELEGLRDEVRELSERFDEKEQEDYELAGTGGFEPTFKIYGFFDLNLFSFVYDESNAQNGIIIDSMSFIMSRLNLYFHSQMTETLGALVEIRFTFLPNGHETSFEDELFGKEYERVDTRVLDPFTSEEYNLGGLMIERAHLTWKPHDAFGVIAGRFLTPFGIWNVNHGSPVLLPIRTPYFMVRSFMPPAQTGLQVFGRFFPADRFYLNYAVTVSNGRGATEATYDLDDNKALGLRLRASYEGDDVTTTVGGYLFWGTVREVHKRIETYEPFHIEVEDTARYSELIGSADLQLRIFGFRLEAEYIQGMVQYSERPLRVYPVVAVESPLGEHQPDYVKWAFFGLVGYEFAFGTSAGNMSITPYFAGEYNVGDDTFPDTNMYILRGGLNFRPSPFVALKAEFGKTIPNEKDSILGDGVWMVGGQMAVSF